MKVTVTIVLDLGGGDGRAELHRATEKLKEQTAAVEAALSGRPAGTSPAGSTRPSQESGVMANQLVDDAIAAMTAATSVDDSVLAWVAAVPGMIEAAVQEALAGGATAAELEPLTELSADLTAKTAAIVAAITPNTPVSAAQAARNKP